MGSPRHPGVRKGVIRGDWGTSLVTRKPVTEVIGERLPNTLLLMLAAEAVIIIVALLIGIYSALNQYSAADNILTGITFFFYSMPVFFFALGAMYLFSVNFKAWGLPYLPTVGMFEPAVGKTPAQVAWHMILPVATLSFGFIAGYSRYIRSTMLEAMGQDYVRTAKSQGPTPPADCLRACLEERRLARSSPSSPWTCLSCWAGRSSPSASSAGPAPGDCSWTMYRVLIPR